MSAMQRRSQPQRSRPVTEKSRPHGRQPPTLVAIMPAGMKAARMRFIQRLVPVERAKSSSSGS